MIHYRKIGGLHWLSIGRLRLCWCITKPRTFYRHGYPIYIHR